MNFAEGGKMIIKNVEIIDRNQQVEQSVGRLIQQDAVDGGIPDM